MKKVLRVISLFLATAFLFTFNSSISKKLIMHADQTTKILSDDDLAAAYSAELPNRVSVHDPSVVYDGNGTYYIFGSHMAWAKSTDLKNWATFINNINSNYSNIFEQNFEWAAMGDSAYAPSGNLWAPDVIYNQELGKWCMYMSINGWSWNSSIAMLTADSLDGDWTYAGTVIYSGFTDANNNHDFNLTDYQQVTGDTSLPARYKQSPYTCRDGSTTTATTTWNTSYGAHAIDPCVFYDENGNLYMTYGSWSGGIYIIELDELTGLRDYSVSYDYVANSSDPYMGIKLAGGGGTSGEASYVEYIDGYYYLFVTNGGLVANGGYNMRVYRSENPTGPYTDISEKSPKYTSYVNNINNNIGTRLMSYYKWSYQKFAQVAQGHNSAVVGPDGKAYLVYHTRTNNGTEGHSVRVHQLFTTQNHYLVAAPFEYDGETISSNGYSDEEIAGTYEVILQSHTNYSNLEYRAGEEVILNPDGTISGAYSGTWSILNGEPYCNLMVNGISYEGVFVEQTLENTNIKTMAFTAVNENGICIWGAKYPAPEAAIAMAEKNISIANETYGNMTLPASSLFGVTISWESSNPSVISSSGQLNKPSVDTEVTLTATFARDNCIYHKEFKVLAHKGITDYNEMQVLGTAFINDPQDLSSRLNRSLSIPNPYLNNEEIDFQKGVKIKFDVEPTGAIHTLGTIISFLGNGGDSGRLYFTPGSYLGYNATGGYFDANLYQYGLVKDYIGSGQATVEICLSNSGFEVYVNGEKAYDKTILENPATGSGTLTDYSNMMNWLVGTADTVYFGAGSWWEATGWDEALCKISNVYFYAYFIAQEPETTTVSETTTSEPPVTTTAESSIETTTAPPVTTTVSTSAETTTAMTTTTSTTASITTAATTSSSTSANAASTTKRETLASGTTSVAAAPYISVAEVPQSIKNPEMVKIEADEAAFSQPAEIRLKDADVQTKTVIEQALAGKINADAKIFPMDIGIYAKGTNTKLQPQNGNMVTITCPIPEELLAYKDKIAVVCVVDGKLEVLHTGLLNKDGVWCVVFKASHFSPYAFVVDETGKLSTLAAGEQVRDSAMPIARNGIPYAIAIFCFAAAAVLLKRGKSRR